MLRFFLCLLCVSPCLLTQETGRCQGKDCVLKTWHKVSCKTDDDCNQPHAACFKQQCLCDRGYFYTTNDTCTSTCSTDELQDTFTEYPNTALRGNHLASFDGVSLKYCKDSCLADKRCLTFDFRARGGRCRLHNVTALESSSYESPKRSKGWTHYQRSCEVGEPNTWQDQSCTTDDDCNQPHAVCYEDQCRCDPGFFFTTPYDICSGTCSTDELQDTFTEYPNTALRGDLYSNGVSLEDCKDRCLADKRCLTFDFRAYGGRCRLHNVTARESPSGWSPKGSKGWTHYQRSCKSTFASHDNWYNLLCHSKMDCHDPNSDCLSGRCTCHSGFKFNKTEKKCRAPRAKSGVYTIQLPYNKGHLRVGCIMNNGGWLIFQRRFDRDADFDRNWTEYEQGLSTLHTLTSYGSWRLSVFMENEKGIVYGAVYSTFRVGGPETNYKLTVSGYSGTAGDQMSKSNGYEFSTYDRDPYGCTNNHAGAWWYPEDCGHAHLNSPVKGNNYWRGIGRVRFSRMEIMPQ